MKFQKGEVCVNTLYGRRVLGWAEPSGDRYGFHYISRSGERLSSSGSSWTIAEEALEPPSSVDEVLDAAQWRLTERESELRTELAYVEQGLMALANVRDLLEATS